MRDRSPQPRARWAEGGAALRRDARSSARSSSCRAALSPMRPHSPSPAQCCTAWLLMVEARAKNRQRHCTAATRAAPLLTLTGFMPATRHPPPPILTGHKSQQFTIRFDGCRRFLWTCCTTLSTVASLHHRSAAAGRGHRRRSGTLAAAAAPLVAVVDAELLLDELLHLLVERAPRVLVARQLCELGPAGLGVGSGLANAWDA